MSNLGLAANWLKNAGIIALIEPINPIDMPSNFVTKLDQEFEIIKKVGAANLKLQFDFYHRAMVGKGIVGGPHKSARYFGKIKIGGMPGRNEPNSCTLNYTSIFQKFYHLNHHGRIGCGYRPDEKMRYGFEW